MKQLNLEKVKQMAGRGHTAKQIAEILGFTHTHILAVMRELRIPTRKGQQVLYGSTGGHDVATCLARVKQIAADLGVFHPVTIRQATPEEIDAVAHIKPMVRKRFIENTRKNVVEV